MTVTDVFIHPHPRGDSTIRRMALTAREYGFDTLVVIDNPSAEYHGVSILKGAVVHEGTMKAVNAAVRKQRGSIIGVAAGESSFNRSVIQTPGVALLTGICQTRRNAFDHVTARFAAEKKVAIHLEIGLLIACRGHTRQKVLTRYRELLTLQRKYEFPFALGSGAESILDQRSVREMILLCGLFGMEKEEVLTAFATIPEILLESSSPRVVS